MTNKCPNCGAKVNSADKFCQKCGKPLPPNTDPTTSAPPSTPAHHSSEMKTCPICDTKVPKDARYCPQCSHDFNEFQVSRKEAHAGSKQPNKKHTGLVTSAIIVALLAIGGGVWAHQIHTKHQAQEAKSAQQNSKKAASSESKASSSSSSSSSKASSAKSSSVKKAASSSSSAKKAPAVKEKVAKAQAGKSQATKAEPAKPAVPAKEVKKPVWNPKMQAQLVRLMLSWETTLPNNQRYALAGPGHDAMCAGEKLPTDFAKNNISINNQHVTVAWSNAGTGSAKFNVVAIMSQANGGPSGYTYLLGYLNGEPTVVSTNQAALGADKLIHFETTKNQAILNGFKEICSGKSKVKNTVKLTFQEAIALLDAANTKYKNADLRPFSAHTLGGGYYNNAKHCWVFTHDKKLYNVLDNGLIYQA